MIDEGLELKPYRCTADALTIGYGRNLDSMGIRQDEAELMLRNDVKDAKVDAMRFISLDCWDNLSTPRRSVIINMAFNLGLTRLSKFKNFRQALIQHDYHMASVEMLDSQWARQVGNRAIRLSEIMKG
jgi:lysozyme